MSAIVSGLGLLSSRETVAAVDRAILGPSSETLVTVDRVILCCFGVGEDDVIAAALHFRGIAFFTLGVFFVVGILQFSFVEHHFNKPEYVLLCMYQLF